jgi:hypothetical protein
MSLVCFYQTRVLPRGRVVPQINSPHKIFSRVSLLERINFRPLCIKKGTKRKNFIISTTGKISPFAPSKSGFEEIGAKKRGIFQILRLEFLAFAIIVHPKQV